MLIFQTSWNDINDNGSDIPKYVVDGRRNLIVYRGSRKRPGGCEARGQKIQSSGEFTLTLLKHGYLGTLSVGAWNRLFLKWNRKEVRRQILEYRWKVSEECLDRILAMTRERGIRGCWLWFIPESGPKGTLKRKP